MNTAIDVYCYIKLGRFWWVTHSVTHPTVETGSIASSGIGSDSSRLLERARAGQGAGRCW
ncbi:hypothetical protein [Kamptonema formosum]|uniref:hypothetical protein n=1 Tax=Kamptonema formosum TaxID=331992 RepID=UPI0012DFD546|nr:hypothetical protein [Oscillatoria sp. PCC 10802]